MFIFSSLIVFLFGYPGYGWLCLATGMVYDDGNDDRLRISPLCAGAARTKQRGGALVEGVEVMMDPFCMVPWQGER